MIDGYGHIGLPRFWSAEDYLAAMRPIGVAGALVCPFDSCCDLEGIHRAIHLGDGFFRGFGLALGHGRSEIESGLHAQFDAGFEGLRLTEQRLAEHPWIADVVGKRHGIILAIGSGGLASSAAALVSFLDRHPGSLVIAPHFAGPTDPDLFERSAVVAALFAHPRFRVVFSRHKLFDPDLLHVWSRAIIDRFGWDKVVWGSEAPVAIWRDEALATLPRWIDRFQPGPAERAAFLGGTLTDLMSSRPRPAPAPLRLPYDPRAFESRIPAPMFPGGLPADTRLPARLVQAWLARGGDAAGPLSDVVNDLLTSALDSRDARDASA